MCNFHASSVCFKTFNANYTSRLNLPVNDQNSVVTIKSNEQLAGQEGRRGEAFSFISFWAFVFNVRDVSGGQLSYNVVAIKIFMV